MKLTKIVLLGAVAAAALNVNQNLRAANFSLSDLSNRAVAASPRAKEQFPWLTRPASPVRTSSGAESRVSIIKKNRAFASSPRVLEQFPQLARAEQPTTIVSSKSRTGETAFDRVVKNNALAASPRMKEQFPQLASQPANASYEVAPVK